MKADSAVLTIDDMERIAQLVRTLKSSSFRDQQQLDLLDEVLQSADAMASEHVPIDVIGIDSCFRALDLDSRTNVQYTLVFPENADISEGKISILTPVGTAVLGHRVGDVFEAEAPGGTKRLKIEYVSRRERRTRIHSSGVNISAAGPCLHRLPIRPRRQLALHAAKRRPQKCKDQ